MTYKTVPLKKSEKYQLRVPNIKFPVCSLGHEGTHLPCPLEDTALSRRAAAISVWVNVGFSAMTYTVSMTLHCQWVVRL